jgi:hypothetical protein
MLRHNAKINNIKQAEYLTIFFSTNHKTGNMQIIGKNNCREKDRLTSDGKRIRINEIIITIDRGISTAFKNLTSSYLVPQIRLTAIANTGARMIPMAFRFASINKPLKKYRLILPSLSLLSNRFCLSLALQDTKKYYNILP